MSLTRHASERPPEPAPADTLPLDRDAPRQTETATFALGCFWGPDAYFGSRPGVVRTRVGYAGGDKDNPSYHDLGRHIETVEVDYDPAVLGYEDLLEHFWTQHDPTRPSLKRQYQSAIFYRTDDQERIARASTQSETDKRGDLVTELIGLGTFYLAEIYHQKYQLRHHDALLGELKNVYDENQLVNSTVAARLNGLVTGYGRAEWYKEEVERYGLSSGGDDAVMELVRRL